MRTDIQTYRRTEMTKLILALRNFAKAPNVPAFEFQQNLPPLLQHDADIPAWQEIPATTAMSVCSILL